MTTYLKLIPDDEVIKYQTKRGKKKNNNILLNEEDQDTIKNTTNRNRRRAQRCFVCGHWQGQWTQLFIHGRWTYHFLCNECLKIYVD